MSCAYFRLDSGTVVPVIAEPTDGRFDMRRLAGLLGVSIENVMICGFREPCLTDGKSFHTIAELPVIAQHQCLPQDGSPQSPFSLSIRGVDRSKFKATDEIASPSNACCENCASTLAAQQFYNFRPLRALPLAIYVRAFGLAQDALEADRSAVTQDDWNFVSALLDRMPQPNGASLQDYFASDLRKFLHKALGPKFEVVNNTQQPSSDPDLKIHLLQGREKLAIGLVQVAPEIGFNGEPSIKNTIHYAKEVSAAAAKDIYFTGHPMLLLELAGPHLRLSGALFLDKAVYEPLTPYLSLLNLHDQLHLLQLGRAAAAIRVTLLNLKSLYLAAPTRPRELRCESALWWPYRLQELFVHESLEQIGKRAVFRVVERNKIVKFVHRQYGVAAHQQWADCGHAPKFVVEELPGSWKMITMDELSARDGWIRALELKADYPWLWNDCKVAVGKALERVQAQAVKMAHGDIREPNVMYNANTGEVIFLDFDWAGPSGTVFYPPLLNKSVPWAAGVVGNMPILASHDCDAIKLLD